MTIAVNSTNSVTLHVLPNGESVMSSNDLWYRLFRAFADLYLAGEIDADTLDGEITSWSMTADRKSRQFACPAATQIVGRITLAMVEPDCPCDPYRETACSCPPADRRQRLLDLIGP